MHIAVFEARWDSEELMAAAPSDCGQAATKDADEKSSAWTGRYPHKDGTYIYGAKRSYHINHCMSRFQTVVTAVIANPQQIGGIGVEVQLPDFSKAEQGYLKIQYSQAMSK